MMNGKRRRREKRPSCAPKIKHESLREAQAARELMEESLGAQFYISPCVHCKSWHVIHQFNRGAQSAQASRSGRR
jgi:hypothetical protein